MIIIFVPELLDCNPLRLTWTWKLKSNLTGALSTLSAAERNNNPAQFASVLGQDDQK